jgi:uncharacterized membrane protein
MKSKKILPVVLILFYLIVISRTILLFYSQLYFPDLDYIVSMSLISQEFLPYAGIIKILMGLIVFSLIPGFYIVRKAFKENISVEFKNIFIALVVGFSAIPPLMALLNNYFTGDFLFSIFLLVYGVLFTIIAFILRDPESKKLLNI